MWRFALLLAGDAIEQTVERLVIGNIKTLMWRHCNNNAISVLQMTICPVRECACFLVHTAEQQSSKRLNVWNVVLPKLCRCNNNAIKHIFDSTNDYVSNYGVSVLLLLSARACCWATSLRWRHNGCDSVSNHQSHDCLLNRLFRRRSKKTSKLRVTGLCVGKSPGTDEFPPQMASNAENVSIWWRHVSSGRRFGTPWHSIM